MNKDRLKVKGKKFLLGCAVLLSMLGIFFAINIGNTNTVQPVQSKTPTEIRNTYIANTKVEDNRGKAVISAIGKKYDGKIKALQDKQKEYTDKKELGTAAAYDCDYDIMILQDQQMIETEQENLKHLQNTKGIYDSYSKSNSSSGT
jgi:hypothetical protein